jgi:TolB-like protein
MRRIPTIAIMMAAVLAFAPLNTDAQVNVQDRRPGVAVLPFEDGGWMGLSAEDRAALGVGLQQLVNTQLSLNTNLRVIERNALQAILKEIDYGRSGHIDPQTAVQIGRLVGARYLVLGSFSDLAGSQPTVNGRIVDGETGEFVKAAQATGKKDELYKMTVDFAASVTAGVNLPALPAEIRRQQESRAQKLPAEAVTLFARAQIYNDTGRAQQAEQLYEQIVNRFPDMQEAKDALTKMRSRG